MKKEFWSDFSWVLFFIVLILFVFSSGTGVFLVPSSSMEPTLLPGDRILANKLAYGINAPFFSNLLFTWSAPQRGDVVLLSFAGNNKLYVKRVIGLAGDEISFSHGMVNINGQELKLKPLPSPVGEMNLYEEGLCNGKKTHTIYMAKKPSQTFFEARRFLVPPGKLFVLGDSRDNSNDSRVYGYVDVKRVYGKAQRILFSTTGLNYIWPDMRSERGFLRVK